MRIALLAAAESWYAADLRRAAADRHDVMLASFRDLQSDIFGESIRISAGGVDLAQCEAVLVRSMPAGSLEQIVFRMDALAQLEQGGVTVVNPAKALEVAVDKYLALARLAAAELPVPKTITCQTVAAAMQAYEKLGGDVVIKPLFGSEGRGIARLTDAALAERAFSLFAQQGAVLYLQEFVPHDGYDIRVLVIGNETFVMHRRHLTDWRTNISRGAIAECCDVPHEWLDLARRAAKIVGAPIAGVDLLPAHDGRVFVIEVNAVPGWRALAEVTGVDIAARVIEYLEKQVSQ